MKPKFASRNAVRAAAAFAIFTIASVAFAHEFWIDPRGPAGVGTAIPLEAWSGVAFRGENRKPLTPGKLRSLRAIDALGSRDLLEALAADMETGSVKARAAGPLLLVLHSNRSYLELEPAKFDEYLTEAGLESIRELRVQRGEQDSVSRELYQRCAKSIIYINEAGDTKNSADTAKKELKQSAEFVTNPAKLPLEIVPCADPSRLRAGAELRVRVLYQEAPLANALVQVFRRASADAASRPAPARLRTDADGFVTIPIGGGGDWLASCVHMERAHPLADTDHPGAQWESFWASLTWRVDGPFAPAPLQEGASSKPAKAEK
ncbi:MAG: DUF4198 domain-containing protein [Planctomycetes bacterium]|nr:DUF4198 domain-containing protein [Planctomycetota bacterium]